ncbi:hypothetical protein BC6307_19955 [Sutcliffiella cohnii]|uniref:Glycosyltransferase 2-like domain-containing protein n=1 Tax=Sutcliffiella cohnii TaxID=33932 RepID=A0A223KVH7_9BACI|nr:glycosyltransferase family A protein [Sutcliffiella cohnii]AST93374.1 hypothetical protein BC6307_19955 [Sutcliffiella cohnii]
MEAPYSSKDIEDSVSGKLNNTINEYDDLKQEYEDVLYRDKELSNRINELKLQVNRAKSHLKSEQHSRNKLKKKYDKLVTSTSWRLTSPIRKSTDIFKSILKVNNKNTVKNSRTSTSSTVIKNKRENVRNLDRKLWGGFFTYALEEITNIKNTETAPVDERVKAARALARLHYDKGNFQQAAAELAFIDETKKLKRPNIDRVIPEIKVMKKIDQTEKAKQKVWETIDYNGFEAELCISMAYLNDNEQQKLKWFNLIYEKNGLSPIEITDTSRVASIENIYNPSAKKANSLDQYKISIIIPAYNSADSIHIALESLLKQTLSNIEIIVVDDCSQDNTIEVVTEYTKRDNRIKLIKKEINQGAYMARNTALGHVTGDYITIHDGDDWSHSQKLELQLQAILDNSNSVGSVSYLIRSLEDLTPVNAGSLLSNKFIMMNSSSLLFHKSVLEKLGGWDSVRVAGDTEFIWRIENLFGKESIVRVLPKVPLSFALSNENSLTGKSATHVKTIMYGLRRTYRESFQWWHKSIGHISEFYLDPKKVNRSFPCPVPNMVNKPESRLYDFVYIADFSKSDAEILAHIKSLRDNGNKVAIFHWPHYNNSALEPIADEVYQIVNDYKVDILVVNEVVETDKTIIGSPEVLEYALDSAPEINTNETYVFVNENNNNHDSLIGNVKLVFNNMEPKAVKRNEYINM